eukprot:evm.model.scf_959.3 EVM.evm.TU.scf_959.3   scf_959:19951-27131(-)
MAAKNALSCRHHGTAAPRAMSATTQPLLRPGAARHRPWRSWFGSLRSSFQPSGGVPGATPIDEEEPLVHREGESVANGGYAEEEGESAQAGPQGDVDLWIVSALFIVPALGGLLFGYDIGATSGALVNLTTPATAGVSWYDLTPFQSGLFVSLSLLGALLGSVGAFLFGDKLGRKKELLLASGLYGTGALISAFTPTFELMTVGRTLYGLGIGFAMHSAPAYIAETAPPRLRGFLISLKEAVIVGGILLGYLSSYFLADVTGGWRGMYGIAIPLALALLGGSAWAPESARWLLLSGAGRDTAREALVRTKGNIANVSAVVESELDAMAQVVEAEGSQRSGDFQKLLEPKNVRPLLIGTSLMFFQQITGQPSVLYYASTIFQQAGFSGASAAAGVSVVLGVFKLVMTSIAALFVDVWGRRPLLLWGVSGLVMALLGLGGIAFVPPGDMMTWLAWGNVGALLVYVGAYQLSFGPISWLLAGELFPLEVRGQAVAVATFVNFGTNWIVSLWFPSLQRAVGMGSTYLIFAAIGVMAVFSIFATVPETKGKSLEEIEQLWISDGKTS